MTTSARIWNGEIDALSSINRDNASRLAPCIYYALPHGQSDYVEFRDMVVGSSIDVPVAVRPGLWTIQTDVSTPQLADGLDVAHCGLQYIAQPYVFPSSRTEELESHRVNPFEGYFPDHLKRSSDIWERGRFYQNRIRELARFGRYEGISFNGASENDFWIFLRSAGFTRQAGLALMDSGNLRAVWKGDDGDHLGIHFLGDQNANYVIFKRRLGTNQVSRVAGNDTLDGVKKQVRAFNLASLVNA